MRRNARVDRNQKEIVEELRAFGAEVLHIHQLKNCFDILVFWNGNIYPMEIKASTKDTLTEGEQIFKDKIEAVGCKYHIVYDKEHAIYTLINN